MKSKADSRWFSIVFRRRNLLLFALLCRAEKKRHNRRLMGCDDVTRHFGLISNSKRRKSGSGDFISCHCSSPRWDEVNEIREEKAEGNPNGFWGEEKANTKNDKFKLSTERKAKFIRSAFPLETGEWEEEDDALAAVFLCSHSLRNVNRLTDVAPTEAQKKERETENSF